MKGLLVTHKGMEDLADKEVIELGAKNPEEHEGCVSFDIPDYETLIGIAYRSQTARGVYALLHAFTFDDILKDFEDIAIKIKFDEWLDEKSTFNLRCRTLESQSSKRPELEKKLSAIIINHIQKTKNYKQPVDLEHPDVPVHIHLLEKEGFVGIDLVGFDLSKRPYHIFTHPSTIKGTIAYALVRLGSYSPKKTLLDCYGGSGTIAIEAALFVTNRSPNFFTKEKFLFNGLKPFEKINPDRVLEKLDKKVNEKPTEIINSDESAKYISFAKKNCKIAGVAKSVSFSRMNVEWLDMKLKKGSVDIIATKLPHFHKDAEKHYKEFFYRAEFILKKNGTISIIAPSAVVPIAKEYDFLVDHERTIFSGKAAITIYVMKKNK